MGQRARKRQLEATSDTSADENSQAPQEAENAKGERQATSMPDRSDAPPAETSQKPAWHRYRWAALALAPVLFVLLAFAGDRALHGGRVLRGVYVEDVSVGGLDAAGVRAVLDGRAAVLGDSKLTVVVRSQTFDVDPTALSFALDVASVEHAALEAGRDGGFGAQLSFWLGSFSGEHRIPAHCSIDGEKLEPLVAEWERTAIDPVFEGAIRVQNGQAVAEPPRSGHRVDRAQAKEAIAGALCARATAPVTLALVEAPAVRDATVTGAALEQAKKLLAGPVVLVADLPPPEDVVEPAKSRSAPPKPKREDAKAEEPAAPTTESFTFTPEVLAQARKSRLAEPSGIVVYLDPEALEPALADARKKLERPPVDARFEVESGDKVRIVPSRTGRIIAGDEVAAALFTAAQTPERRGAFPVEVGREPALTTEAAQGLGIKGLVASFTTTHPCCKKRVKNIHRIADLIDGVLLKPNDKFSINEHVGPRTTAKGFLPAPTIVLGEEKDTIGGGVSQFATTFFNAAFYGGYEIVERQPHSYWFRRYPMGHEATLSWPKPDVIIQNDTTAGLLIKTYYTEVSITVKLYGDNGGRKVKKKVSHPQDLTQPPIEYIADSSLDPTETKVKARGAQGWSIMVGRTVVFADGREKEEERKVTYKPRVRQLRVHPCRIPKGEDGYTGEQCPEPKEEDDDDDDDTPSETPAGPEGPAGDPGTAGDDAAEE
jgi:vancomycin resistance protein YoaR